MDVSPADDLPGLGIELDRPGSVPAVLRDIGDRDQQVADELERPATTVTVRSAQTSRLWLAPTFKVSLLPMVAFRWTPTSSLWLLATLVVWSLPVSSSRLN